MCNKVNFPALTDQPQEFDLSIARVPALRENDGKTIMEEIVEGVAMNAIRIRKKLDSETLNLPELCPLLGQNVEIIVLAEESVDGIRPDPGDWETALKRSGRVGRLQLRCILLLLLMACAVLAAPAPKEGWERPIDPDNDCKIDLKDGTVTIELPGTYHDLDPKNKRFNAPRMLREVEGDFVVQVRVSGSFRPSAKSSVEGMNSRVAAGLLLTPNNKDFLRLEYESYRRTEEQRLPEKQMGKGKQLRKPELRNEPAFKMMLGTQFLESGLKPPWKQDRQGNEEQIYLRFEWQEDGFREAISRDGKTWTTHISMTGMQNLPRKLKVGLAAYSTSTEPFKVRFDQFKLIRGGKKSK